MIRQVQHSVEPPVSPAGLSRTPHDQWLEQYGPLVAEQLEPERRYALVRVGVVEFAYSDYDRYLRALGQTWETGFAADPLPSSLGRDLPAVAPHLRGVDLDLTDLELSDIEPAGRRFS